MAALKLEAGFEYFGRDVDGRGGEISYEAWMVLVLCSFQFSVAASAQRTGCEVRDGRCNAVVDH